MSWTQVEPGLYRDTVSCQNEIEYEVYGRALTPGINPEEASTPFTWQLKPYQPCPAGIIDHETTCNFGLISEAKPYSGRILPYQGEARSLSRPKLDELTERLTGPSVRKWKNRAGLKPRFTLLYPEISLKPDDDVVRRSLGSRSIELAAFDKTAEAVMPVLFTAPVYPVSTWGGHAVHLSGNLSRSPTSPLSPGSSWPSYSKLLKSSRITAVINAG